MNTATKTIVDTGIRAIDLFAPLVAGGVTRLSGPLGTGQFVIAGEIVNNLARNGEARAVYLGPELVGHDPKQLERVFLEQGIDAYITAVLSEDDHAAAARKAAAIITEVGRSGALSIAIVHPDLAGRLDAALGSQDRVVTIVMDEHPTAESWIELSREMARAGVYPAIDPLRSGTRVQAGPRTELAARLRQALAGPDLGLRVRIQSFLAQPFSVAEPWTARQGEYTPFEEAAAAAHELLG